MRFLQSFCKPILRGLSTRSIRRYVKAKGLKQQVKGKVFDAVKDSVTEVSLVEDSVSRGAFFCTM